MGILLKNQPVSKSTLDWYYVFARPMRIPGNFKQAFDIYQRILAEDYTYQDVHRKSRVEKLIKKYKEMDLVSENPQALQDPGKKPGRRHGSGL